MSEPLVHTVATAVVTIVCAVFTWPMYWANRKVAGTFCWAVALSLIPLALIALSTQPFAPVWLGVVLANHLFLAYGLILVYGTRLFFNLPPDRVQLVIIAAAFSLPFLYFTYVAPDVEARIIIVSTMFIITAILVAKAVASRRCGEFTIGAILIYAVTVASVSLMTYRIFYLLFVGHLGSIFNNSLLNSLVAGISYFASYGLTLSFYMLCNEKQLQHIKQLHQEAEEQKEQKSRFLAYLSHELRTPLNAIVGKAQLIALKTDSDAVRYDCGLIVDAGLALSTMATQILQHSRLEHGKVQLEWSDVQLHPWLNRIVDTYQPLALEKSLIIQLDAQQNQDQVFRLDQGKVNQVLTNLLQNAIKYSDKGTIVLKASLHGSGKILRFEVIDEGIGIEETEHSSLLQPFIRADHSKLRDGSGLGLALSQKILQLLDSSLHFSSKTGQGSHFWFDIKAELQEKLGLEQEAEITRPLSILLVEDIGLNQQIIAGMLAQDRHLVLCADSVAVAAEFVTQSSFDLILLDMNLPDGNGLQFYQFLRQLRAEPPPVIVLTADVSSSLKQQCLQQGIAGVLHKPLTMNSLRQAISNNVSHTAVAPAVRQHANATTFFQIARYLPLDMVRHKLEILEGEITECIQQIHDALAEQGDITKQAHKLSSLAATLGLELLADQSTLLEQQGQRPDPYHLRQLSELAQLGVTQLKTKVQSGHD